MKKALLLLPLLVLSACTLGGPATNRLTQTPPLPQSPAPAGGNNVSLFGRDTSATVEASDVATPDVRGYVARPKADGIYPGVVMVHEWWGLNDNIKEMARLLASDGYTVFAVDLYNGEVTADATRAAALSAAVQAAPAEALAKLMAAAAYLRERYAAPKLASLGWCFGGGQSLNLSLAAPLDATVIYYGQLTADPAKLAGLKGPVLGIFGETDTTIPVADVNAFKATLDTLDKTNEITVYPGLGHAFANPSGANYAATETVDAWDKTLAFLDKNLKTAAAAAPGNATTTAPSGTSTGAMEERPVTVIRLTAKNFRFYRDNVESPAITVKAGGRVRVELASEGGTHDFVIDELSAATDRVGDGQSTSVEFTAPRTGEYEYYCSVGSHRAMGMKGKFVVE